MKEQYAITIVSSAGTYENMQLHLQSLEQIGLSHLNGGGIDELKEYKADIIIVEANGSHNTTCSMLDEIGMVRPDSLLLLISPEQPEPDMLKKYMIHGVRDIIGPDDEPAAIIKRSLQLVSLRAELQDKAVHHLGKTICFFSAKGGVGKSFLAMTTAQHIAATGKFRTILVDLDLQFGDIDLYLDANSLQTIGELADEVHNNSNRFSDFILDSHIHKVNPMLHLLSAPVSPEKAEIVDTETLSELLDRLRKRYDFVILDFGTVLNSNTLAAFDVSDRIMLVISNEMAAIKNAGQTLQLLKRLQVNDKKIDYVINKHSNRCPVNQELMMKLLNRKAYMHIPLSKRVTQALNQGKSLVENNPGDPAVKAVSKLVRKLAKDWKIALKPEQSGKSVFSFLHFLNN